MIEWSIDDIFKFVESRTGERREGEPEGPVQLGRFTVWRCWTFDEKDYHAHHVIHEKGKSKLLLKRDFPEFANWLDFAFDANRVHARQLEWLRSSVASIVTLALLGLVIWAVVNDKASGVDFRWLVGALATTSFAYLLGSWNWRREPLE